MASLTDGTTTTPQATTDFVQPVGAAPLSGNAGYAAPNAAPAAKTTPSAFSSEAGAAALAASATKAAALTPLPSLPSNLTAAQFSAATGNAPTATLTAAQLAAQNQKGQGSQSTSTGTPPPGWDAQTYANFKAANPGLEPNAQDTAKMLAAGSNGTPSTVTLVNKETGQEYTINNPTADQIANFKAQGWDMAEGSGDGTGIIDTSTDPAIQAQQAATDKAKADVAAATAKLTSFNVSNDPVLQAQLASITAQWNTREAAMTNYNSSQVAATTTLGYRSGMQYSGGAGGAFGGIITAEEQEGVSRIGDLEAQKQQALSAATTAYSNQEWDRYSKLVDVAEQAYHDQVDQLNKLQTNAYQATKDAQDEQDKQQEDYYNQNIKPVQDIADDAAKNGAPASVISKITAATNQGDAISAAGDYLQTGTGDTALYLMYKRDATSSGQVPEDYSTWENAQNYNKAFSTGEGEAAGKAAGTAQYSGAADSSPVTNNNSGAIYNAPASIAPYVGFGTNGAKYVDLSDFAGTPTEKNQAVQDAENAGYKVITNKNSALDLVNIQNATSNLSSMKDAFDANAPDSASARDTYKAQLNNLESFLQTNPSAAAIDTYNDTALDILKAISGVQGFRGGAAAIENVKETLPQLTDTKAVADQKIANIETLIGNRQNALIGPPSASDVLLNQGAQDKTTMNSYITEHPDQADTISSYYNVPGATDSSVLAYLKASGQYKADPAAQSNTRSDPFNSLVP